MGDWSQTVSCRDVGGRQRELRILLDSEEVVVIVPPGEVVRLTPDETRFLVESLQDAEGERQRRRV